MAVKAIRKSVFIFVLFQLVEIFGVAPRPHIVLILADDLGWNDVSFHGSDQIPTPNIDALAYSGIILNSHYVLPICTPSRAALMTGLYPIHTGMQGLPMLPSEPRGLPEGKILPEYLKELGYRTEAIGKWHLGYHRESFLPRSRGFDSFLGYYNGFISYYDYIVQDGTRGGKSGFDMRRNETAAHDLVGEYATKLFTDYAVKTIREHDPETPLFMYLSHLGVHAGNAGRLLEAPPEDLLAFRHILDPNRRTYAAMVSELDKSIGRVMSALEEARLIDNAIVLFLADNGAPTVGLFPNWGSNYPFKGIKDTLWEGGVRGAAVLWSPLLSSPSRVSNQLIHMTDWLPTLYAAAGGLPHLLPRMDGINQWFTLSYNYPSQRSEVLLNIDEVRQVASIRADTPQYNWKLVVGTISNGTNDGYFGQGTNLVPERNPPYNINTVLKSQTYTALERAAQRLLINFPPSSSTMLSLRQQATVRCRQGPYPPRSCDPRNGRVCLYDLRTDPCERSDLSFLFPQVARELFRGLIIHRQTLVPQLNKPLEPELSNPDFFNGTWSPWYDANGLPLLALRSTISNLL